MLNTNSVTYVRLSDVLAYMGYPEVQPADVFQDVSFGDASYTIMSLPWVLGTLRDYLDCDEYRQWTDEQLEQFMKKERTLCTQYSYVDMES